MVRLLFQILHQRTLFYVLVQLLLERIFYDQQMLEILRHPSEPTEYDPRIRPWFIEATQNDQVSASSPYLFYFLKKIGTTVSYQPPGSSAVIAADVTMPEDIDQGIVHPHAAGTCANRGMQGAGLTDRSEMVLRAQGHTKQSVGSHQRQIDQVLGLGNALRQVNGSGLRMKWIARVVDGCKPAVLRCVRDDYEADLP